MSNKTNVELWNEIRRLSREVEILRAKMAEIERFMIYAHDKEGFEQLFEDMKKRGLCKFAK